MKLSPEGAESEVIEEEKNVQQVSFLKKTTIDRSKPISVGQTQTEIDEEMEKIASSFHGCFQVKPGNSKATPFQF